MPKFKLVLTQCNNIDLYSYSMIIQCSNCWGYWRSDFLLHLTPTSPDDPHLSSTPASKFWIEITQTMYLSSSSSSFLLKMSILPRYARVRRLPIWGPSTHPWIPPIQDVNQALQCPYPHTLSKSFYSSPYICPCHLHLSIGRYLLNHPHFTSICHASPHSPHSAHPEDCTNPHPGFLSFSDTRTSISPASDINIYSISGVDCGKCFLNQDNRY